MADVDRRFPDDPALDLLKLDAYGDDPEKKVAALRRLDAAVGGDAYVKGLLAENLPDVGATDEALAVAAAAGRRGAGPGAGAVRPAGRPGRVRRPRGGRGRAADIAGRVRVGDRAGGPRRPVPRGPGVRGQPGVRGVRGGVTAAVRRQPRPPVRATLTGTVSPDSNALAAAAPSSDTVAR